MTSRKKGLISGRTAGYWPRLRKFFEVELVTKMAGYAEVYMPAKMFPETSEVLS